MIEIDKKFKIYFLIVLAYLNILTWIVVFDLAQNNLKVIFFDVGQGDSVFIETPEKHQILIDGGPDISVLERLGESMPFYDRTIDLIVLTHPDHDHMAGLIEVLKRYRVENVLWTNIIKDGSEYDQFKKMIEQSNIVTARFGQRISSGKGFVMDIIHPFEDLAGQKIKNLNNTSIINRVFFGQQVFLLTGDASKSIEKKLIEKEIDLKANVLKLGHHGSKTSTSREFIEAVNPEIGVISCGKDNRYNHPDPEVLAILNQYGINILRTDQTKDIKIISDGQTIKVINN